jgi:gluconolactonase
MYIVLLVFLVVGEATEQAVQTPPVRGLSQAATIVRLDPALDAVVPAGTMVEQVYEGSGLVEGPLWTRDGSLLFSDMAANVISRLTRDGHTSVFVRRAGYDGDPPKNGPLAGSNGLTFDNRGRLIVCERGNRRLIRREPDGGVTVLADRYQGTRLTRPNDVVVKKDGAIYFTDMCTDCTPDLPFQAIFRIANGRLEVAAEMPFPNGLAFSHDERYLYVSNSDPNRKIWMRFRVERDGTLGERAIFFDATDRPGGVPDGLKTDTAGNLYATGAGGVWIISPAGTALGRIELPDGAVNVAWGDDDGRTLYMVGRAIYRVRLNIPGARPCCI